MLEEISSFSRRRFLWSPLSKDPSVVAPDLNEAWQRRGDLRIGLADEPCSAEGSGLQGRGRPLNNELNKPRESQVQGTIHVAEVSLKTI